MRIERINENSIRCTLTSFDLSVRDLNIKELAYGTEKARKLFTEMMTRASNEVGFEADGTPIMIEAIPMSSDSIQLVITKVENPEELDERFSKFSNAPDALKELKPGTQDWLHRLTTELLEGAGSFLEKMQSLKAQDPKTLPEGIGAANGAEAKGKAGKTAQEPPRVMLRAVGFDDLSTAITASQAAYFYEGDSTLYRKPGTRKYVLLLKGMSDDPDMFSRACNVLTEYGYSIRTSEGTGAYYDEHYDVIVKSPAIRELSRIK